MTEWIEGILKDSLETEVTGRTELRKKKGKKRYKTSFSKRSLIHLSLEQKAGCSSNEYYSLGFTQG